MLHRANSSCYGVRAGAVVDLDPVLWAVPVKAGFFTPLGEDASLAVAARELDMVTTPDLPDSVSVSVIAPDGSSREVEGTVEERPDGPDLGEPIEAEPPSA